MNRYLIAAALALGLSGEARAEEATKQEPQGVSLGALVAKQYEAAMEAKPVKQTAAGEVPLTAEESVEQLTDSYQRSTGARKVELAAHLQRLAEAAGVFRARLVPEGATPIAGVLESSATELSKGLHLIPGYGEATSLGAEWESVVRYFSKKGAELGGGFELFGHKNIENDKRLRVRVPVGSKAYEMILRFDAAGKLEGKEEALVGEKGATLSDIEDFIHPIVHTKAEKTGFMDGKSVKFYSPATTWFVAALNSFLKKGGIEGDPAVPGSDVRVWYGTQEGEERYFVKVDDVVYPMDHMKKGRFDQYFEFERRHAKARHDGDIEGMLHYGKKKDFRGNLLGSEEEIDAVKKEVALGKNNVEYIRDLAKRGKLSDEDITDYLKGDQGKQVYVMIGLMGIRRDTKGVEAYGIVEGESYQARVNLAEALTSGKIKLEKARSLVERLHERRKFVKSGDEKALRAGYVQLSTEGAERDLFDAGLVEGYNPETKKWEKVTGMWEPGIGAGLNAVTINQLAKAVVYGQAVIEPKSPEKKDK